MIKKCCGTCRFWDHTKAMDAAGRVRGNAAVKCGWPIPPLPVARNDTIRLTYTSKTGGKGCPVWEERK